MPLIRRLPQFLASTTPQIRHFELHTEDGKSIADHLADVLDWSTRNTQFNPSSLCTGLCSDDSFQETVGTRMSPTIPMILNTQFDLPGSCQYVAHPVQYHLDIIPDDSIPDEEVKAHLTVPMPPDANATEVTIFDATFREAFPILGYSSAHFNSVSDRTAVLTVGPARTAVTIDGNKHWLRVVAVCGPMERMSASGDRIQQALLDGTYGSQGMERF